MQTLDGKLLFGPTDLVGHLWCEHLTQLERRAAAGEIPRPRPDDPELAVLTRRGLEHERRYLERLAAKGHDIVTIAIERPDPGLIPDKATETFETMKAGASIIYQAVLFDGAWVGYADFLKRVERPSDLGGFSYEPVDTLPCSPAGGRRSSGSHA